MQYNDEFYQPPYSPAPSTFPAPTRTPPPVAGEPPNLVTAIFNAVIQNNVGLVSSILSEKRFNPDNLRNRDGKTPLMVAACENYNDGESALYQAAASGSTEVVEILIVAHANVELGNKETITPIMIAAYNGHADICRILLDYGRANINYQDKFRKTALMLACYAGRFEAAEVLLDRSADVNLLDQYGWTSLMIAAYAGHVEICHLLLHHNADKNIAAKDKTAVILARDVGHHSVANLIENYVPGTKPPVRSVRSRQIPNHDQYSNVGGRDTPHYARQIQSHRQRHQNQSIQLDEQNPYASKGIMMPLVHEQSRRTIQPKNANRRSKYYSLAGPGIDDPNPAPFTAPHLKQDMAPRKDNSSWVIFSLITTSCFCNPCLSTIGRMKDPNVRQAWREKVALCIIILIISGFMGFLAFGLATIACQKKEPLLPENILRDFGPDQPNAKAHIVRGRLYNTGVYFLSGSHRPIAPFSDEQLNDIIVKLFGKDISGFFPPNNLLIGCAYTPKDNGTICSQGLSDPRYHCHTSSKSLLTLKELDMNQFVGYSWDNVTDGDRQMFVYKENVYDITDYLNLTPDQQWLGDSSTTEWLRSLVHKDATKDVLRTQQNQNFAKCFDHFLVGEIDGTTIGCVATNVILIVMTVVFTTITLIKFTSAVAFSWFLSSQLGKISKKPKLESDITNIILLVTCYSEGEGSMRTTIDSLAASDYPDDHKLLFVIADGDVTGSENDRSTPQICKDLLTPLDGSPEPEPKSYLAIGDGQKQHNMAQVYIGYYNVSGHKVPMVLVIKCGTPEEKKGAKAGNRGKRDSQLILMQWLSHIIFNERMTPLEFELFEKVRLLTKLTPDRYEMVLMVDADTVVKKDSVKHMIAAMERDPTVMGLCGETKIANKTASWVTMIQVFEYYISHHLGKAFESIFGGVTCLPGCFCMYRIKAPKDGYSVPILANPDIVEVYSSNTVETLHQKNLLLLGEDRYLTTLMLRTFPKRKMIYVPKAICKTVVPDEFKVLLSQRRRWINSTIHNLMELILVPQLCGIFCCSMQFVIFLELVGTVVLPSSLIFLVYLAVMAVQGQPVLLPLIFICAMFLLQAVLVIFTSHRVMYVLWMIVYIFAIPIWNFLLPVYAFWHFDDFSWGATRKISGEDTGHGEGGGNKFDRTGFPMKRWDEWMLETQKQTQFLPAYAPPNNASSYPTTTGMGMSPSRPTSPLPPQQPQALATITLFIFDIGKLWSIFGTLHIIGEVIVMLLLSQGGKISSYWFYGIVGGYIFLVNVINISLSWPYDAIWFKWQGFCSDFAILIVFTRIYLSTSEYVREQTSAQLPIIDDEDMNMENSSSRNEENSIAPKIINHPNQLLLLCFASFIHILGNVVHTFNPFDGRRYIVLNLSYAITFPCIALYIYLDTHCTSVLQSKRILLPDTPDWKVIVITIICIVVALQFSTDATTSKHLIIACLSGCLVVVFETQHSANIHEPFISTITQLIGIFEIGHWFDFEL
nr:8683_t:CDS:10 [Entrophospora candida]